MWYKPLLKELYTLQNAEKAAYMQAYMRDLFPFLGIPTPLRKSTCLPFLKQNAQTGQVDFAFPEACYEDPHRELQYAAIHYLSYNQAVLTERDIPQLKSYIIRKSWWDTIDGLDRIVGDIALRYPGVNQTLLAWSLDDNIWLRRIAIDHQLQRKEKTDTELLAQIIRNNLNHREFFINKAIGWSLREYSKTDPAWVRNFLEENQLGLAKLSVKEASKYLE